MKKNLKVIITMVITLSTVGSITGNAIVKGVVINRNADSAIYTSSVNDSDRIMNSFKKYLVGDETTNNNILLDSKINGVHNTANTRLQSLLSIEDRNTGSGTFQLFKGVDLGTNEKNLSNSYLYLYQIAIAIKTYKRPDSSVINLYENKEAKAKVIEALEWLYTNYFENQEKGCYGNWYEWEIGMPMNITKTLMLLKDEINEKNTKLIGNQIKSMDLYLRNGKDGDIDLNSRFHTGANLADIATDRIIQGALINDSARIQKAVDNILTVFKIIDPDNLANNNADGYYEDGSFIQHGSVAYTGTYGNVLLTKVIQTLNILDESKFDKRDILTPVVKNWIYNSFSPVIFEGYMMEIVKGRAVSRTAVGYSDVNGVVETMVGLCKYLEENDKSVLMAHIKYVVNSMKVGFSTSSFLSPGTVIAYNNINKDTNIVAKNYLAGGNNYEFNSMDKTVNLRDDYAFSISRSSNRISKYEYMSGENLMPWFQGDGAFYLYQSGADQSKVYGANYYATISPYKLPGTTVPLEERKTIPQLYGKLFYENTISPLNFTSSSESQNKYVYFPGGTNTFSGGVKLGKYGVSGIVLGDEVSYKDKENDILSEDFVVYKNAQANKSYFMFDDEIVLMGSGIKDDMNRKLITTIDNKMFDVTDKVNIVGKTIDGNSLSNPSNGSYNLSWVNYNANKPGASTGYYFLDNKKINIESSNITESLRKIRTSNPDTKITKNFFTMLYNHEDTSKSDNYAYVLMPNADVNKTEEYSKKKNIVVLANTDTLQAVLNAKLNIKGFNFFSDKVENVAGITSFNKASIMVKYNSDSTVNIAVSDPTFSLDKMKLEINIDDPEVISATAGVQVTSARKKALIKIDAKGSNGKTFEITLKVNSRK